MVPLFSEANLNKFQHDVQNEVTLICTKFGKDLFSISKVIGRETKWPRFFWPTLYSKMFILSAVQVLHFHAKLFPSATTVHCAMDGIFRNLKLMYETAETYTGMRIEITKNKQ